MSPRRAGLIGISRWLYCTSQLVNTDTLGDFTEVQPEKLSVRGNPRKGIISVRTGFYASRDPRFCVPEITAYLDSRPGLPLTFKFWKSRLPGCQFWKSIKENLEVWYFEGWQIDDRTMYMCMEIIALINLLRGNKAPPSPPPPPPPKKKRYTCLCFSKSILDITIFGHHKCSDTLFFLKRYLFNVPYTSRHLPYRVFLLSVNVRTPKTCPLFLIKPLFFTTGIFCMFALFTYVSG